MNLTEILLESSGKYEAKPAVIFEGRTYSFQDIDEGVRRYALWLKEMGIRKGDRIALQLDKGMEFVFLHLAGLSVGVVTVPLNPAYAPDEVAYYVSDSGSALYITDAERWNLIRPETLNHTRPVLVDAACPDGSLPLREIVSSLNAIDSCDYPTEGDDVAVICYTSGTTGRSKGAMITHRNLISNMKGLKKV
ncbi:MAG: acyl--CoA ligase, partial [Deltaproteobacteria bacterium]|nr:acyl--CoA ligase [Deltaproteobacteria bacterium]